MTRTFVETPLFTRKWHELELTDYDLRALEAILLENPKQDDTISHTGGLRKIRIPMESRRKGKRGGARVLYVDAELKEKIHFVNVYSKDEKDDLTPAEKKAISVLIKILKEE